MDIPAYLGNAARMRILPHHVAYPTLELRCTCERGAKRVDKESPRVHAVIVLRVTTAKQEGISQALILPVEFFSDIPNDPNWALPAYREYVEDLQRYGEIYCSYFTGGKDTRLQVTAIEIKDLAYREGWLLEGS
jgi:hypothetical protein